MQGPSAATHPSPASGYAGSVSWYHHTLAQYQQSHQHIRVPVLTVPPYARSVPAFVPTPTNS
eukprot:3401569-Rhodomonas_salina.3